jgi:quinol monooxygenase YgiN
MERREFIGVAALSLLAGCAPASLGRIGNMEEAYGLIAQMKVVEGKRGVVIAALLEGTNAMPGNIAYLIAEDQQDPTSIWITEVWETKEAHAASLELPGVQQAIGSARPHITGFGTRIETKPVLRG